MKKVKIKNLIIAIYLILFVLTLSGCADSTPLNTVDAHVYGFWGGLWHGFIAPFDFIGMLIWDDVAMYAPNNNGGWYAFGFLIGCGGLGFGGGRKQ